MSKMVLVSRNRFITKVAEEEAKERKDEIIPDGTPLVFFYSSFAVEKDEDPMGYEYGIITESRWEDMCHDCYGCIFADSYEEAEALDDDMYERLKAQKEKDVFMNRINLTQQKRM